MTLSGRVDIFSFGDKSNPFSIHDWNGDELLDMLVLSSSFDLYKNRGTSEVPLFTTFDTIVVSGAPKLTFAGSVSDDYIIAEDLNGDKLEDLIIKSVSQGITVDEWGKNNKTSTIDIYINVGTKTLPSFDFAGRLLDSTDGHYGDLAMVTTGDLNDDGAIDIVMSARTLTPNIGWNIYLKRWELFVWWGIPETTLVAKKKVVNKNKLGVFVYDATQRIIMNQSVTDDTKIFLYSINGSKINIKSSGNGIWKLSNNLSTGIYFLKADNIDGWSQKIMVK